MPSESILSLGIFIVSHCVALFTGGTRPPELFGFSDSEADGQPHPRGGNNVVAGITAGVDITDMAGVASVSRDQPPAHCIFAVFIQLTHSVSTILVPLHLFI